MCPASAPPAVPGGVSATAGLLSAWSAPGPGSLFLLSTDAWPLLRPPDVAQAGHSPAPWICVPHPLAGGRRLLARQAPFLPPQRSPGQGRMLAGSSTCLFSGVCAALLAVALAYYLYW